MKVGVLALQGAFKEHIDVLNRIGCQASEIRQVDDLRDIEALVLPGGESTTVSKLLESSGLFHPLRDLIKGGMPTLGTCAGMILLANNLIGSVPGQKSLGVMDISVQRNAFGSQIYSFERSLVVQGIDGGPFRAVFIRAPAITEVGSQVRLTAQIDGRGVAAESENIVVTAFHPELVDDVRIHEHFLDIASEA